MQKIINKIKLAQPTTISDFFTLYKEIKSELPAADLVRRTKIAILASFTTRGFTETLFVKCCEIGVAPEIYVSNYNQYNQEILNETSGLYQFCPDLTIIFIDTRTLLGDLFFLSSHVPDEDRRKWAKEQRDNLISLIARVKSHSTGKILFHNFEVPHYSPLGILENKQQFGFIESVEWINWELRKKYKNDSQVFVFDFNAFSSNIGKSELLDYKMYYMGDLKIAFQHIPALCEDYLAYIKPLASKLRKCIVLDLDNTLWGGVVGEEGLSGIKVGATQAGRSFLEFQKHLLSLFQRGVVLAINSKNNLEDVQKVFREHPDMVLREEHFAAILANWNDKASNLRAIAEELNIGLDSLVFFDDEKINRELVRSELPEVLVVDLPDDPALFSKTLQAIHDFNIFQLTEEDKEKGRLYADDRRRQDSQVKATDITAYLRSLEMEVEIEEMNNFNLPRLSQLTQKTNQFNMTTRRYTEEHLRRFHDGGDLILSIRVRDKFGDNGIIGAVIVKKKFDDWFIDTLLLSCRVIGRKIEDALLSYLVRRAKESGVKKIIGQFIPTAKNAPAKDFYKNSGFRLVNNKGSIENWVYQVSEENIAPDFIKIIFK